jgi:hypothetical protein
MLIKCNKSKSYKIRQRKTHDVKKTASLNIVKLTKYRDSIVGYAARTVKC